MDQNHLFAAFVLSDNPREYDEQIIFFLIPLFRSKSRNHLNILSGMTSINYVAIFFLLIPPN